MKRLYEGICDGISRDGPMLIGMAAITLVLLALLAVYGIHPPALGSWKLNLLLYAVALVPMVLIVAGLSLREARPVSPIHFLVVRLASDDAMRWLGRGLPLLFVMIASTPIFSAAKTAIPLVHAYDWDAALGRADRLIFGMDAWRVLQPVLGFPIITSMLSYAYHAWMLLMYAAGAYFCFFEQDQKLRAQYFIARCLVWTLLGLGLATGFASVGPCFVGPILGDPQYDALTAYLHAANEHYRVMVLPVQQTLVDSYLHQDVRLGGGISAMPSLHVATTLLWAMAAWRTSRFAGACLYVFLVVIVIGSIHLGYHYAVDGFVSLILTSALWQVSGVLARKMVRRQSGHWSGMRKWAPAVPC